MTSTRPPFAGAAVVETLRSSTGFPEQGPCLFDGGFPPLGPRYRIFTSGLLCMPVAPQSHPTPRLRRYVEIRGGAHDFLDRNYWC